MVEALDEVLPIEDRAFLKALCSLTPAEATMWRESGKVRSGDAVRLERVAQRLMTKDAGQATALLRLLPDEVFEDKPYSVSNCDDFDANALMQAIRAPSKDQKTIAAPDRCSVKLADEPEKTTSGASLLIAAPADATVRLIALTPDGTVELVKLAKNSRKPAVTDEKNPPKPAVKDKKNASKPAVTDERKGDASFDLALFPARVPYGSVYLVSIEPKAPPSSAAPRPGRTMYPSVFWGQTSADLAVVTLPIATTPRCLDFQAKATGPDGLRVLVDGVELAVDRSGDLFSGTLWIPIPEKTTGKHRLAVTRRGEGSQVLASRTFEFDTDQGCTEIRFDLTTRRSDSTVGMLDVDAGGCVDAGIDSPKLLSFVESFIKSSGRRTEDLRSWGQAAGYLADVKRAFGEFGTGPVGADRGRLDSVKSLASAGEELIRQGFASLLIVNLRCSRKSTSGWDYSLVGWLIDLKLLQSKARDPISGLELDDEVRRATIELISERTELGQRIEIALGTLLHVPVIAIKHPPAAQPFYFPIETNTEAYVPRPPADETGAPLEAMLAFRELTRGERSEICERLDDIQKLRARRAFLDLEHLDGWRNGTTEPVPATGDTTHFLLSAQPVEPKPTLLRASLRRVGGGPLVAVSYACIDLSHRPIRLWTELGGWFPLGSQSEARTESSGSFVAMVGLDSQQSQGWFTVGGGVGYSFTARHGRAPSTWDVGDPGYAIDGSVPYEIIENAVYLLVHVQGKLGICQPWWPDSCTLLTRRLSLTARVMVMPGLHIVDKSRIEGDFPAFKGTSNVDVVPDIGVMFQPGVAVQVSSTMAFDLRFSFGTQRLFDFISRSEAEAKVYRRAVWGVSMGLAWEL